MFLTSACVQDDSVEINTSTNNEPAKFTGMSNRGLGFTFIYDSLGHLNTFIRSFDEDYGIRKRVTTDQDGYVRTGLDYTINSSGDTTRIDTLKVDYSESLITKISYLDQYQSLDLYEFTYDSLYRFKTIKRTHPIFGTNNYREFKFTYTGNNVSRIDEYLIRDGQIHSERYTLLTYDNNPSPYKLIEDKYLPFALDWLGYFPVSENNVIERSFYDMPGDVFKSSQTYNYTYRSDGYPESSTTESPCCAVEYFYK